MLAVERASRRSALPTGDIDGGRSSVQCGVVVPIDCVVEGLTGGRIPRTVVESGVGECADICDAQRHADKRGLIAGHRQRRSGVINRDLKRFGFRAAGLAGQCDQAIVDPVVGIGVIAADGCDRSRELPANVVQSGEVEFGEQLSRTVRDRGIQGHFLTTLGGAFRPVGQVA